MDKPLRPVVLQRLGGVRFGFRVVVRARLRFLRAERGDYSLNKNSEWGHVESLCPKHCERDRNAHISDGRRVVSVAVRAAEDLRELASPLEFGEPIKVVVERAARRVRPWLPQFKFSRAYEIWYRRARRIEQYELDAFAQALEKKRTAEAANELHELKSRIARLESLLVRIDPSFHRQSIDAARSMVRSINGKGGAANSTVD